MRKPNGTLVNLTKSGHVWDGNRCGRDLIVSEELEPEQTVDRARRLRRASALEQLTRRARATGRRPARPTAKSGSTGRTCRRRRIRRCDRARAAARSSTGFAIGLSASPDGRRLAFVTMDKRGSIVQWIAADGGEPHDVAETETGCPVGWASRRHDLGVAPARPQDRLDRGRRRHRSRDRQDRARQPRLLPTLGRTPRRPSTRICASSTTRRRRCGSSRTSTWRASRVFVGLTT